MLDYIYNTILPYITYSNIIVLCSIVVPILVMGTFWKSEARQRVFQILGDLNRRYKNLE